MQADGSVQVESPRRDDWYARQPEAVAEELGVDPGTGLSSETAADRLRVDGPNALPEERPKPGWLRFIDEYRSYMQIILLAAAVVSLFVREWGTAILLVLLTVLNAVIGLRQEGKAESAMNALKSMMKATARIRRDSTASEIPAERVVAGDVVLISAGDQVPADGRIVAANALQIDESALTGESTPAAKDARTLDAGSGLGPGDQSNMVLTKELVVTVALTGLYIAAALLALIVLGGAVFGDVEIGRSIAFTSFALCLIVAALECRSATGTVLTTATFDSKQMNRAVAIEVALAVMVTQMDVFQRLLDTVEINLAQFLWAVVPAVGLLVLWELGKLVARRTAAP